MKFVMMRWLCTGNVTIKSYKWKTI